MKNITLSLDEELLAAGRKYALRNNISFSELVRRLLQQTLSTPKNHWLEDVFNLMDQAWVSSGRHLITGKSHD